MSNGTLPDGVLPDLAWDNPELPASDWQGIERLELQLDPMPGFEASVRVFFLFPTIDPGEYTATVSGPSDLAFEVTTDPGPFIEVRFPATARGTFFITLVQGTGLAPVHPFFASASFTFTIDCETGDCRPPGQAAAGAVEDAPPVVDLLTKDYDGFVRLLGERAQVRNPNWSDLAPASFERTLIELLAHHGDMLSYNQDRVASEAFLDTASQRYSLRQHGLLLGHELFDGEAASTLLSFSVDVTLTIPEGFAVRATTRADEAQVVYSVAVDAALSPLRNPGVLRPAQWPDALSARVPAGATSMLLFGPALGLAVGQSVAFVLPGVANQIRVLTEIEHLLLPGWVNDPTLPLVADPPVAVTRIHWSEPLVSDLPVWQGGATPGVPFAIHANLVPARHGEWKVSRVRASATTIDDTQPDIPLTPQSAVMVRSPVGEWQLRALRLLHGPVLFDRVEEELVPALEVTLDGEPWFDEDHLHRSQPFDRHFTTEADNDGRLWLTFGDGVRGRAIELTVGSDQTIESAHLSGASELRMRYRVGVPLSGNIDPGKLVEMVPHQVFPGLDVDDVAGVTNVTPGQRGPRA